MRNWLGGIVVMSCMLTMVHGAWAQKKKGKVITLAEVTIVGRVQKPIAAVDVARIRPSIALTEMRQSFVNLVVDAIYEEPF